MNLGKILFYLLLLEIIQAIVFSISGLFFDVYGIARFSIIITLYLILSFIFIYFYYPKEERKKIFSNTLFYRDSGIVFLFLMIIAIIKIYF